MKVFLAYLFCGFLGITATHAATPQCTVVGIADGDTITVLDTSKTTHKIRLSGIDAPEKNQPSEDRLVYGSAEVRVR